LSNANVILNGASIQVINQTSSAQQVNSSAGNPTFSATYVYYNAYENIGTSPATLTLPDTTVWVAWVKNLSATANLTVTPTPVAGGTPLGYILVPGGVWAYWNPAKTAGGLSAISLTASALATPVEVLLAA
jgi:hypothetical protein